ncbi:hypothetical protein BKA93DRAFT_732707 [Sparassis latifolia]
MQAWVGEVRRMAFRMQEAGMAVDDQDMILALTMGLSPSYEPLIISLDAIPTDQLTLESVVSRLLNEKVRQTSVAPTTSAKPNFYLKGYLNDLNGLMILI